MGKWNKNDKLQLCVVVETPAPEELNSGFSSTQEWGIIPYSCLSLNCLQTRGQRDTNRISCVKPMKQLFTYFIPICLPCAQNSSYPYFLIQYNLMNQNNQYQLHSPILQLIIEDSIYVALPGTWSTHTSLHTASCIEDEASTDASPWTSYIAKLLQQLEKAKRSREGIGSQILHPLLIAQVQGRSANNPKFLITLNSLSREPENPKRT